MTDFKTVTAEVLKEGSGMFGVFHISCKELPGLHTVSVERDVTFKFPSRQKIILEVQGGKKYRAEYAFSNDTDPDKEVWIFHNVREVDEFDD